MNKAIKINLSLFVLFFVLFTTSCFAKSPKYIFYFVADGLGVNQIAGTEMYLAEIDGEIGYKQLCFSSFPISGLSYTYSSSSGITDSAAAGTALSTGKKTNNGILGILPDKQTPLKSIAYMAKEKGKRVGICTTVSIDHATPAAFYANSLSRDSYYNIGVQMTETNFDFFAGSDILQEKPKNNQIDAISLYDMSESAGYTIARGYDDYLVKAPNSEKIILFHTKENNSASSLKFSIDQKPEDLNLKKITIAAIDFLMKEPKKGFFLMVEGGKIDQACHGNDAATCIQEVIDMDEAIKVAYDFYLQHKDETLIVVTADHETGGFGLGNGEYRLNLKVLQHQKMSEDAFTRHLQALNRNNGKPLSWEDVQKELKENFGFWDKVRLNPRQAERLRTVYNETFGSGEVIEKQEEYYKVDNLSDLAINILNEIAQISWGTGAHSAVFVPVFAIGAGAENFSGRMDNIEIPEKIATVAGYR